MAEKPEIPVDEVMGRPLYFAPSNDLPRVPGSGEDYDRTIANFHHPVFERRKVEEQGQGGAAARDSALQWSIYWQHVAAHREWGGLNERFPDTPEKQYDLALSGIARCVGEKVIRFTQGSPEVSAPTRNEIDRLRTGETIILGNNGVRVRRYLLDYPFERGGQAIDLGLVRKFLRLANNPDIRPARKMVMANYILRQAIDPTISVYMRERYAYARENGLLRPDAPKNIVELVRSEIQEGWPVPHDFVAEVAAKCELLERQSRRVQARPRGRLQLAVAVQA